MLCVTSWRFFQRCMKCISLIYKRLSLMLLLLKLKHSGIKNLEKLYPLSGVCPMLLSEVYGVAYLVG